MRRLGRARHLTALAALATSTALGTPAAVAQPCMCLTCFLGDSEAFRSSGASMMPNIAPRACLVVDRGAAARAAVKPGDVVAYRRDDQDGTIYLTRIVATGGQTISLHGGRVSIDGTPIATERLAPLDTADAVPATRCPEPRGDACRVPRLAETLPNGARYEVLDVLVDGMLDFMPERTVPAGHVFGLADNRDNGIDSRVMETGPGFIALDQIVGPVTTVTKVPR
ncbi:signal peptidase I [Acuticoccus sp. I52.16.1]|uniref:signal peptidase I n=1 Tax=Acuticoccus sp. I52.16.1 TaxID=2928472 RepID=UPI001FD4A3A1|nr:signal peptidase I [Acuticoccus sp. I52.16.1]UOM35995.1 signal peptidase I [Acuticoccus sp. I52.16.1]